MVSQSPAVLPQPRLRMRGAGRTLAWSGVGAAAVAFDVWVVANVPWASSVLAVVSRTAVLVVVALGCVWSLWAMRRHAIDQARARVRSDIRADHLRTVAAAGRRLVHPDVSVASSVVTDAAVAIGWDTAVLWTLDRAGNIERMAAWSGARPRGARAWGTRLVELVRQVDGTLLNAPVPGGFDRTTDGLDSDPAARGRSAPGLVPGLVVACPVYAGADLVAVLAAVRHTAPDPVSADVECLELLAAQAGAALNNARRFAERATYETQLQNLAFHDFLTGLPNRVLFLGRLEQALERARQDAGLLAMLVLDLDGFKTLNDSLSHEAGDELLVAVASRIGQVLGTGPLLARFGGDEFTVLVDDLTAQEDAIVLAEQIQRAIAEPFPIRGRELYVTASIGIAYGPQGRTLPGEVLRDADLAMYAAKQQGRGGMAVFTPDLSVRAMRQLELESDLRRALERGELTLRYQPIISIGGRRLAAVETLVRWNHPGGQLVLPADFIETAEETGLIVPLGRWVLREACTQAERWRAAHDADGLMLAVNLSAAQLQDPGLVHDLAAILAETGFPPERLVLEITESVMMQDMDVTMQQVHAIDRLGVRLTIDDFGTGYSSLSRLKGLPLHGLKIDKSFVAGLGHSTADRAIVHSVVTLAHDLRIDVTAEGIENAVQLQALRTLGCDTAQGFYICEPLDTDAVALLLASYRSIQQPA
jgi:diguanylate cyclase (GGDEF)-like protein